MPGTYDNLLEKLQRLFDEMEQDHPGYFKDKKAKEIAKLYAFPFVLQTIRPLVHALESAEMDMSEYKKGIRVCRVCKQEIYPSVGLHLGTCYFEALIRLRRYKRPEAKAK